jgi:hypothetical protein
MNAESREDQGELTMSKRPIIMMAAMRRREARNEEDFMVDYLLDTFSWLRYRRFVICV